jgi:hypothetical protein
LVPNGVLIYDIKLKKITFANREMSEMVEIKSLNTEPDKVGMEGLKSKLMQFYLHEKGIHHSPKT